MPYATLDDVLIAYPQIGSMIGTGSYDVSSTNVESYFIANAEAQVNAALRDRYVVPLAEPVDPLIRKATVDIVICDMVRDKLPKTPEFIVDRCTRVMAMLGKIRDGKLDIGSAEAITSTDGTDLEVWSTTQQHHGTFDPTIDPIDQTVDRDRVKEEVNERTNDLGGRNYYDDC